MPERKRKARDVNERISRDTPAYRVIYGVFMGLTPFCQETGVSPGTAYRWLEEGIIPARRQKAIIEAATAAKLKLRPGIFEPRPEPVTA
jgi:hypothetical protein